MKNWVLAGLISACVFLSATVTKSEIQVTLIWDATTDPTVTQVGFYRDNLDCAQQGPLQPLYDAVGNPLRIPYTTSYVDATIPDGSEVVCYEITFLNDGGESGHSVRATKNFPPPPQPPPAPTGLKLSRWNETGWILLDSQG